MALRQYTSGLNTLYVYCVFEKRSKVDINLNHDVLASLSLHNK